MKYLKLTTGEQSLVDDDIFDFVNQWSWRKGSGYSVQRGERINGKFRTVYLHRVIMNAQKGLEVDHINGNVLDNRVSNLRVCTHAQNMANYRPGKSSASGFRGVHQRKPGEKWTAHVSVQEKAVHLGNFDSPHQAAMAYDLWAKDIYGDFAKLNFTPAL